MKIFQKTSHAIVWLVFSFLLTGCVLSVNERKDVITIYENSKAAAIEIARDLFKELPEGDILKYLSIHLKGNGIPVLGEITIKKDHVLFNPVIAFTPGLTYEVRLKNELIATVTIPGRGTTGSAKLVSVYPSVDTVPENLLKIYIEFSQPMQQGYALENIVLSKNEKDTVPAAFLDLQPELWNKEGTVITLWLDPGRIKRDLQPNKSLGSPLEAGSHYRLLIKQDWQDAQGNKLGSDHAKNFFTGLPDKSSPNIERWEIQVPKPGSSDPLSIRFKEPLDHYLLKTMLWITDSTGKKVDGVIETIEKETILVFTPSAKWKAGNYTLEADAKLEDLAGNNLNRLFDKDLTKRSTREQKQVYKRAFTIK